MAFGIAQRESKLQPALEVLIEACRAAGDAAAARAAADRMLEGTRRLGSDYWLYYALRAAADVALDDGDADRAKRLLDEAEPLAEALDRQRGRTIFRGRHSPAARASAAAHGGRGQAPFEVMRGCTGASWLREVEHSNIVCGNCQLARSRLEGEGSAKARIHRLAP